jgi:ABC-type multidrug transport system fused ATPase/permease subunit
VRDVLSVARRVVGLTGSDRRGSGRWLALPAMALGISAFEVVGAGAVYVLLGLLTAPDEIMALQPVEIFSRVLPAQSLQGLRFAVSGLVLTFFALRGVALVARAYVEQRITTTVSVEIAERLLAGYLAMPYRFHTARNSAELIRNAYVNTDRLRQSIILPMTRIVADFVLIVALGIVVITADPMGAIVAALLLGGVIGLLQRIIRPRLRSWGKRAQVASGSGIQAIQQAIGGIRDIKVLRREATFLAQHSRQRRIHARTLYLSGAVNALPRALIEFSLISTVLLLAGIVLLRGGEVDAALATLGLFAYAGIRIQQPTQALVASINTIRYSAAVVDDLTADLDSISRWTHDRDANHINEAPATRGNGPGKGFSDKLILEDVRFAYSTDTAIRPALDGLSLTIRRGEFIGICGPTGGGKSTLLDVIIGLLPPDSGSVTVDGRALGLDPAWWWDQLGVVSQQVFLTDDTLRRNIAFGTVDSEISEDRLVRAVERAQLAEFVARVADGLDTLVGERGVRLSGGQRQRVAVARALYREPPVIVLDEGTSALDTATETALIRALDTIAPNRTLIAVAHRIATLRNADRIVVVENGCITAEGSYDELLETSATFRVLAGIAD